MALFEARQLHKRFGDQVVLESISLTFEEGQLAGYVRNDLRTDFAVTFFLQAMHGLLTPATMDRLGLTPREILPRAIELFFAGLLTPAGRQEHEKLFLR